MVFSSLFNIGSKALTFFQSIVIAYYFGAQAGTDVFFYCLSAIGFISSYFVSVNQAVLIPEAMRISIQDNKGKSIRFLNFFLLLYVLISLLVILILYMSPIKTFLLISRFDQGVLQSNAEIILLAIPLLFLMNLSSVLVDILTSYKFFTMPMVASMTYSSFALVFIFAFHNVLAIASIIIGLLVGYSVNVVVLLALLKTKVEWEFKVGGVSIGWRNWKNLILIQLGNITTTLGSYLPLYLISGFNTGVVTALNYGQRVSNIPDQLITTQVSQVSAIKFNELYALRQFSKLNDAFVEAASFLMFFFIPISFILFQFSPEIIKLLYQRGAFDPKSVMITSEFLKYFGLTLPFVALNTLSTRLMMAGQKIKASFFSQIVVNVIFLVLLCYLVGRIGPLGYPLSVVLYLPISVLPYNFFLFRVLFPELAYWRVIRNFLLITLVNVAVSAPIYFLIRVGFEGALFLFLSVFYYFVVVIVINYRFTISEQTKELSRLTINRLIVTLHYGFS